MTYTLQSVPLEEYEGKAAPTILQEFSTEFYKSGIASNIFNSFLIHDTGNMNIFSNILKILIFLSCCKASEIRLNN